MLADFRPFHMPTIIEPGKSTLFLPLILSGTASGEFLRPAASRLLLSRFLTKNLGSLP